MRYLTRGRREVGERDVSPQRLVHHRNTWYLDAWCHTREKPAALRARRHRGRAAAAGAPKDMPLRQVQAEMDAGYGIYAGGTRHWATLRFDAQAAQWASRELWHPEQQGRWLPTAASSCACPTSTRPRS
jgi:predicted DNA-binding transcriptional regulator YafY